MQEKTFQSKILSIKFTPASHYKHSAMEKTVHFDVVMYKKHTGASGDLRKAHSPVSFFALNPGGRA